MENVGWLSPLIHSLAQRDGYTTASSGSFYRSKQYSGIILLEVLSEKLHNKAACTTTGSCSSLICLPYWADRQMRIKNLNGSLRGQPILTFRLVVMCFYGQIWDVCHLGVSASTTLVLTRQHSLHLKPIPISDESIGKPKRPSTSSQTGVKKRARSQPRGPTASSILAYYT